MARKGKGRGRGRVARGKSRAMVLEAPPQSELVVQRVSNKKVTYRFKNRTPPPRVEVYPEPAYVRAGSSVIYVLPPSIAGLTTWYLGDTAIPLDGGTVTSWPDSSGLGNTLGVLLDAPTKVLASWNGKAIVRFAHSDVNGQALRHTNRFTVSLSTASVFFVVNLNSLPTVGGLWRLIATGLDPDPHRILCIIQNIGGVTTMRGDSGPGSSLFGTQPISTGRNILSWVFNGANSRVRVNLGPDDAGIQGSNDCSSFAVGSDSAGAQAGTVDGDVAEIVVYNRAVSLAEQAQIEAYLNNKWGVV